MKHGCFAYGWSQVAIAFLQGCWREPHSPSAASASFPVIYTLPASFIYISLLASRELGFASIGTVIEPLTPTGGEASVRNARLHNSLIKVCHLRLYRHHDIAEHKQPTVLLTRLQDVSLGEMLFLFRLGLQAKDMHSSAPQEIRSRRMMTAGRCLTLSLWFSKDGKWLLWSSRDPRPVALSYFFIFGFCSSHCSTFLCLHFHELCTTLIRNGLEIGLMGETYSFPQNAGPRLSRRRGL